MTERVLLEAGCRVTNTQNLLFWDGEGPSAGDTAAAPLTQRVLQQGREDQKGRWHDVGLARQRLIGDGEKFLALGVDDSPDAKDGV